MRLNYLQIKFIQIKLNIHIIIYLMFVAHTCLNRLLIGLDHKSASTESKLLTFIEPKFINVMDMKLIFID